MAQQARVVRTRRSGLEEMRCARKRCCPVTFRPPRPVRAERVPLMRWLWEVPQVGAAQGRVWGSRPQDAALVLVVPGLEAAGADWAQELELELEAWRSVAPA